MANALRMTGNSKYATVDGQDFTYDPGLPQEPENASQKVWKTQKSMLGARRDIWLALACILVPMLGLSALMLGLVFANKVQSNSDSDSPLAASQRQDTDSSAYYVHINSTTFATIASWSSTVAPLLIMAAMSLASFPIARDIKDRSTSDGTDLPTPFQLSLLLETLTGSILSVWNLLRYRRWEHKHALVSLLRNALIVLVISSIVAYAIAGIDTWLHLVMDTVEIDLISDQTAGELMYSRGLEDPACRNQTAADFDVSLCTVNLAVTGSFLVNGTAAFKTLANTSETDSIRRAFAVDGRQLAYLGPASIGAASDFQATTFAVGTQCSPIAAKCDLHVESGDSEPFRCSDSFYGDLPSRNINGETTDAYSGLDNRDTGVVFFADEDLSRLADQNASRTFENHRQNPYHLGVWAYIVGMIATDQLTDGGNVVIPMHGGLTWILGCTSTVYEMTYSWINGTEHVDDLKMANGSVGTIINAPIYYGFGKGAMESNAYGATGESNAQALADSYAYSYSRTALALASGIMSSRPTLLEQVRETVLVARIPKVPLFMLLAFNLLFAIMGVALAVVALTGSPTETNDVRERLSIAGIVAFALEGTRARRPVEKKREMFAEHEGGSGSSARVGIERSQYNGWEYALRQDMKQIG